jgi:hypothetical protein
MFTAAIAYVHSHTSAIPYVKFYMWNPPAGSNQFTPALPGTNVPTWLFIDSPAGWHDTAEGIVGFTASLRVDPNVVTVQTAAQMPDNNWDGRPDSFLGNYAASQGVNVLWVSGTVDATAGTIVGPGEAIQGFTTLGKGAGGGPAPLCMFILQTKSGVDHTTAYSLIHLFDCYYTTPDSVKHPVDVVQDGHYGTPPSQYVMSYMGSLLPPGDPITTHWHELYPTYSNEWDLTSWDDNGDDDLTASDQIDMIQTVGAEVGWKYWFHVDVVTVTIHFTFKDPDTGEGAAEPPELTEPLEPWDLNPIGSSWHMIYPDYCREFVITSWEDNTPGEPGPGPANGIFDPSDQFDFEYIDDPGVTHWAHLDEVTTDIFLSFKDKEPPELEFPLGVAVEVGLIAAVAYIWWTRRRRLKEVL